MGGVIGGELALGLVVSLIGYIIFRHHYGFWVVSTLYSVFWGYWLVEAARYFFFKNLSGMWFWIWAVVVAFFAFGAHHYAYFRKETDADLAAEDAAKAVR